MAAARLNLRPARNQLLLLLLAVIALYVVVPQIGGFRRSLALLPSAQWTDLVLAVLFTALSYVAAAGTYCLLALNPISYIRTLFIQVASMFVNRLLPGGIGGIGVNYLYLHKSGHSGTQAASVVAANNTLGVVGHNLLLIVLLGFYHSNLPSLQLHRVNNFRLIAVVTVLLLVAWAVFYRRYKRRISESLRNFLKQFLEYRHHPQQLLSALACSMTLTVCNVLSLWFCVLAVHVSLPFIAVLVVFSFGIALGTATPTPGGLGGVEAGMVAGLVVYHVGSAEALAAVLIYRLISYWLPLVVGAGAFTVSQRRDYI